MKKLFLLSFLILGLVNSTVFADEGDRRPHPQQPQTYPQGYPQSYPQPSGPTPYPYNPYYPTNPYVQNPNAPDQIGASMAIAMCNALPFDSDKRSCLAIVTSYGGYSGYQVYDYFQPSLVNLCSRQTFASEKIQCLGMIKNKTLSEPAVNGCSSLSVFWSKVSTCLQVNMQTYIPAPVVVSNRCDRNYILSSIDASINAISTARIVEAVRLLNQLKTYLYSCNF